MSIGQFNQWVGAQIMASGLVQIWPGMPVSQPLFAENADRTGDQVVGVRLTDQGVDKHGAPEPGFVAGMDVRAQPHCRRRRSFRAGRPGDRQANGNARRARQARVGARHEVRDRAAGRDHTRSRHGLAHIRLSRAGDFRIPLRPSGTAGLRRHLCPFVARRSCAHRLPLSAALHSASGIVAISQRAARCARGERNHWTNQDSMASRSWSGDGYARIGEGSGSTNMLAGSGVDEAWTTGVQLAESVIEILRNGRSFTQENSCCNV